MRSLAMASLALLAGCWVQSDEIVDKIRLVEDPDTDTETDLGPIEVKAIDPVYGVNSGGTEVVVTAGPLGSEVEVTFGGVPATVVSSTQDKVVVKTPAVGLEGPVDVAVRSGRHTDRLPAAFHYWADGTGKTGLIGSVATYDFDRPALSQTAFEQSVALMYIEPVDFQYSSFYGSALDNCERDYRRSGPSYNIMRPGVASIALSDGVDRFVAFPDVDGEVYGFSAEDAQFEPGAWFDMEQARGDDGWPALGIEDLVQMPDAGFRVTSPNLDAALPTVSQGFDLRWAGGTPGDYIMVRIYRYEGDTQADVISCLLVDDGEHRIDGSLFSDWWWTSEMHFFVGRAKVSDATVPFNGADVEVVGARWFVGLAWQG